MSLRSLLYAYVLGGITFLPLCLCAAIFWTIYTSTPVGDPDPSKLEKKKLEAKDEGDDGEQASSVAANDQAKPRKGWLTVRRTFEEKESDGSYVNFMRTFLDSRSKDPKRSRPKDMWYVVLKGNVLYLYEDEAMTECEAAINLSSHQVVIFPEELADGELFTRRNAICLKPRPTPSQEELVSVTKEMGLKEEDVEKKVDDLNVSETKKEKERERLREAERSKVEARNEAFDMTRPWFIFVRSCFEMEDWYFALVHASKFSSYQSTLEPVRPVFEPSHMLRLVSTIDEQPDVIPMRWLNALIGRLFFSVYRTETMEAFIIGRLMKKLSKVKTPSFLQNIKVTEVSVGQTAPMFSKPMLKELTKEGDASLEIRMTYKGEVRVTVEATAILNLGQRFKTYTVKLVLAIVLRRIEGNLLVKVKRPPSNRIWYAFTQPPDMDLDVEPVVSDRQLKWSMILSTIESRLKEVINESVVLPNMDDIAFFETRQYDVRGGIYADAQRKERIVSDLLPGSVPNGTAVNGTADTPKSLSVDLITAKPGTSAVDTPEAGVPVARAESMAAPEMASSPSKRSWFSSTRSIDTTDTTGISESRAEQLPEDDRGRTLDVDGVNRRAKSVPTASSSTVAMDDSENAEGSSTAADSSFGSEYRTAQDTLGRSSRSSSASKESLSVPSSVRVRSLSSGANVLPTNDEPLGERVGSRDSNSGKSGNFLATLKQRADKQAISNTAKEAMRKWSANWNGFKKDNNASSSNADDLADAGGSTQTGSSLFSFPVKRSNYADIRAAVTGRRERERPSSSEGQSDAGGSLPIDIPSRSRTDELGGSSGRSLSSVSSREADVSPSALSVSQQSNRGPALLRKDSEKARPSPPKLTSDTDGLHTPQSLISPPSPPIQALPIKTQPSQAAVMTIPGIHASHRGEVMSMGYAPPPSFSPDPKAKQPAIQSVYRLFKSPTAGGSQQEQQEQTASADRSPIAQPAALSPEHNIVVVDSPNLSPPPLSSVNLDATPVSPRPGPPPLPPRSLPSPAVPRLTTPTNSAPSVTSAVEAERPSSASSASEALKAIASQDESKRKSLESPESRRGSLSKRSSMGARRMSGLDGLIEQLASKETEVQSTEDEQTPIASQATIPAAVSEPPQEEAAPPEEQHGLTASSGETKTTIVNRDEPRSATSAATSTPAVTNEPESMPESSPAPPSEDAGALTSTDDPAIRTTTSNPPPLPPRRSSVPLS